VAEIRGLSVRPPWSWAIAHAGKDVENRTWRTPYRGLVAIHASRTVERDVLMPFPAAIRKHLAAQRDHDPDLLVTGAIVAVADLYGCHEPPSAGSCNGRGQPRCSPWALGDQCHWQLRNVRPLAEPVPCRGALGLWRLTEDEDAAVRAQLDGHGGNQLGISGR
jgi:hypothetical protein